MSEPALVRPYVLACATTEQIPAVHDWPSPHDLDRVERIERRLGFLQRVLERLRAL